MEEATKAAEEFFNSYPLALQGKENHRAITTGFSNFLAFVGTLVPEGRELSIVKTKLEEACFFSVRGMAKHNHE